MKKFFVAISFYVLAGFVFVQPVSAGTDISVSCTTSTCTINPASFSLFDENNLVPGYQATQKMTVENATTQVGTFGLEINETPIIRQEVTQIPDPLRDRIFVEIHQGTVDGPIVYGGPTETLANFLALGHVTLGVISPAQSQLYFFKTTVDPELDNQFMSMRSDFSLNVGGDFVPVPTTTNTPNNPPGNNDPASPKVCSDTAPVNSPILSFVESSTSDGQVTLQWNAVSGANNYALNFGLSPGSYIYGNNSLGNNTTYTVTGLVPGNRYFFQVIPINGCAPGPRSNEITTVGVPVTNVQPPANFSSDQVLGESTDASKEAEERSGQVLGDSSTCQNFTPFLPIVFLIIQVVISIVIYALIPNSENKLKHVGVVLVIVLSTALFYFLRNCNCLDFSILTWLCEWYVVVAVAVALVTQFLNYAVIEREV